MTENEFNTTAANTIVRGKTRSITTTFLKGDRNYNIEIARKYQNNEIDINGVMEALDLKKTHAYEIMREFQETGTIVSSTVTYLDDIACYQIEDDRHMLDTHFQSNNQLLEWLSPYIRETFQRTGVQNWNIKEISPAPYDD